MCLAILLILAKNGTFLIEQPASSILWRHPRMQELLRIVTVTWKLCLLNTVQLPKAQKLPSNFPFPGIPGQLLDVSIRLAEPKEDQVVVQFQVNLRLCRWETA